MGLRLRDLGSEEFTWADLRALIRHAPRDSAIVRAVHPEKSQWGVDSYLLAIIGDAARWMMWSKTKDGQRNRKRPKPIPRPGGNEKASGRFDDIEPLPLDEAKRRLALPRREIAPAQLSPISDGPAA